MTADANPHPTPPKFQFRLLTLLAIITAACVLLGFLPSSLSPATRITIFAYVAFVAAVAALMIYRAKRRELIPPKETVTVAVDAKWVRRVKSRLIFMPVATLTGVSLTFAPLYLLWCGQLDTWGAVEWIAVPLCFAIIYLVPGFYMRLAGEVIAQLVKIDLPASNSINSGELP
jgi:hypothetical protein